MRNEKQFGEERVVDVAELKLRLACVNASLDALVDEGDDDPSDEQFDFYCGLSVRKSKLEALLREGIT